MNPKFGSTGSLPKLAGHLSTPERGDLYASTPLDSTPPQSRIYSQSHSIAISPHRSHTHSQNYDQTQIQTQTQTQTQTQIQIQSHHQNHSSSHSSSHNHNLELESHSHRSGSLPQSRSHPHSLSSAHLHPSPMHTSHSSLTLGTQQVIYQRNSVPWPSALSSPSSSQALSSSPSPPPSLSLSPSPSHSAAQLQNPTLESHAHALYLRSFRFTPEHFAHPTIGRSVGPGDYDLLQLLGKGDFGRVYLVREKASHNLYAMKVLRKSEVVRRNKIERVLTERHALMAANHPFVVTLYHSFQSDDKLFFIISYCGGGEFYRMLQTQPNKRLDEQVAKYYSAEVLLALEYLHLIGFVYRDLKPENLLLDSHGHIKIADFDLSKESDRLYEGPTVCVSSKFSGPVVNTTPHLTRSKSFVGTEEYLAPEVVSGTGHDASLDWWTFGVFLYELVLGRTPFKGKTRDETFANILSEKVGFPEDVQISAECKSVIRKLLTRDRNRRLGSKYGASEIKNHDYFKEVNWALIRNTTPPIQPILTNPNDTRYFQRVVDDFPLDLQQEKKVEDSHDPTGHFRDFTYHRSVASNTYSEPAPLSSMN